MLSWLYIWTMCVGRVILTIIILSSNMILSYYDWNLLYWHIMSSGQQKWKKAIHNFVLPWALTRIRAQTDGAEIYYTLRRNKLKEGSAWKGCCFLQLPFPRRSESLPRRVEYCIRKLLVSRGITKTSPVSALQCQRAFKVIYFIKRYRLFYVYRFSGVKLRISRIQMRSFWTELRFSQ